MMKACVNVVGWLGGAVAADLQNCTHVVLFKKILVTKRLKPAVESGKQLVWFGWVMECLFRMRKLDFNSDEFRVALNPDNFK